MASRKKAAASGLSPLSDLALWLLDFYGWDKLMFAKTEYEAELPMDMPKNIREARLAAINEIIARHTIDPGLRERYKSYDWVNPDRELGKRYQKMIHRSDPVTPVPHHKESRQITLFDK